MLLAWRHPEGANGSLIHWGDLSQRDWSIRHAQSLSGGEHITMTQGGVRPNTGASSPPLKGPDPKDGANSSPRPRHRTYFRSVSTTSATRQRGHDCPWRSPESDPGAAGTFELQGDSRHLRSSLPESRRGLAQRLSTSLRVLLPPLGRLRVEWSLASREVRRR